MKYKNNNIMLYNCDWKDKFDFLKKNKNKIRLLFADPPFEQKIEEHLNMRELVGDDTVLIYWNADKNMLEFLSRSKLLFEYFFIYHFMPGRMIFKHPYQQHSLVAVLHTEKLQKLYKNNNNGIGTVLKRENKGIIKYQKPVEIYNKIIYKFSGINDIVVDLFAGSGNSCVAAGLMERRIIAFEKDKNIFNFAVKNIEAGLEKKQKYYFFKRQKIRDEVSVNFSQPVRAVETT